MVAPEERKRMVEDVDPTKQGFFTLKALQRIVEEKNKSINPKEELQKIFHIYDEGK